MNDRDDDGLPIWPAAERNKQPILEVLLQWITPGHGSILEVSAATGQHAQHFAPHFPGYDYYVSDCDEEHLVTLRQRLVTKKIPNLMGPLRLDTTSSVWPLTRVDVIYNANMIHIAPWAAAVGLFVGAQRTLTESGRLITYGPYKIDGQHTSASNEAFDASLRARDASFGVRDLAELQLLASDTGMVLSDRRAMPANNFMLLWERDQSRSPGAS